MGIGLIGGSGLEELFGGAGYKSIDTPYGPVKYLVTEVEGVEVIFVPRHGPRHENPPHRVNYLGNIYALRRLGVEKVVATSAVGGIDESLHPGVMVIVDQFIDFTKRRVTFYDEYVVHVDVSKPYCPNMNRILYSAGRDVGVGVRLGGVYVCTEGPRFETPAEINMFRLLGASVVGMTNVPEVVLAREAGLHYSLVSIVTNYAAGMQERITAEEVVRVMDRASTGLRRLVEKALPELAGGEWSDDCIKFRGDFYRYVLGGVD